MVINDMTSQRATSLPSRIGNGSYTSGESESTDLTICLSVAHNGTQILLGGVVFIALIIPNSVTFRESFAQHIVMCTFGYFILMTQAVLMLSPFGWATHLRYENKKIVHCILQVIGSILVITGSILRIVDNDTNFSTSHGICGFTAMLLVICSLIGGLLGLMFPKQMNRKSIKILHSFIGAITLCIAFITIIIAFNHHYRIVAGDRNANTAIVLAVFSLLGTLLMTLVKAYDRIAN